MASPVTDYLTDYLAVCSNQSLHKQEESYIIDLRFPAVRVKFAPYVVDHKLHPQVGTLNFKHHILRLKGSVSRPVSGLKILIGLKALAV